MRFARSATFHFSAPLRLCVESSFTARRNAMIGVDWGTTNFRAFRITPVGTIRDRRTSLRGIVNVPNNRFSDTLREEIGPWLAVGENHVLLSGMIGSRQGWKEAP